MSQDDKPRSIEEITAAARRRETEITLCLAGDLAADADRLQDRLDALDDSPRSSLADTGPRAALESELAEVRDLMRLNEATFRFRYIGKLAWSDLLAAHEPRDDKDEAWNADTFPDALIAASCVDPVMSVEQFAALSEVLNLPQRNKIWNAAYAAQVGETRVPILRADSTSQ